MSIRKKTRNRLLILLVVAVSGTTLVGAVYLGSRRHRDNRAMSQREVGMVSVKEERYDASLAELGVYLGRFNKRQESLQPRYVESLYYYALSRQMVEEPKNEHLTTAVSLWKRYLTLSTDKDKTIEARHKLMEAQLALGWTPEAFDTASEILKTEPTYLKALQVRGEVLAFQRKFPEALASVESWIANSPHDIEAHLMYIQIKAAMSQKENGPQYAAELLKKEPNEPSYQLLASILTNSEINVTDKKAASENIAKSTAFVVAAAAQPKNDLDFLRMLTRQFDALWVQSLVFLDEKNPAVAGKGLEIARKQAELHPENPEFRRFYALRLFQTGNYAQLESYLFDITPTAAKLDGRLAAIKSFALFSAKRRDEAMDLLKAAETQAKFDAELSALCQAIREVRVLPVQEDEAMAALTRMRQDPTASAENVKAELKKFVDALKEDTAARKDLAEILKTASPTREEIYKKVDAFLVARAKTFLENCRTALAKTHNDPLMSFLIGEASVRAGDFQTAVRFYGDAITSAPAWVQVRMQMARLAFTLRDLQSANQHADVAHALVPDDFDALYLTALVNASTASPTQTAQIDKALALINELYERFPKSVTPDQQQQIVIQLSRLGKNDEAVRLMTKNGNATTTPSESDAIMLARLYQGKGEFKQAQDAYDKIIATKPSLDVIREAADLAGRLGQNDKAVAILTKLEGVPAEPGARDFVWADYYSRHGTPAQTLERWKAGLKAKPDNAPAWSLLLGYCLRMGKSEQFDGFATFLSVLPEAKKAVPDSASITYYASLHAIPGRPTDRGTPSLLEELAADFFVRPLFVAHLESIDPKDPTTIALHKCIEAVVESQKSLDAMAEVTTASAAPVREKLIVDIQKLVDENPRAFPIHNFMVGFFGLAERYEQCAAMAARVMNAFPDRAAVTAQVAIGILTQTAHHQEALQVAREWRKHDAVRPLSADMAIVDALLKLRKGADAIAYIEGPYLSAIKQGTKTPDELDVVYVRYMQALLVSNQVQPAVDAVTPLLGARKWRLIWMQFLADFPDDKVAESSLTKLGTLIPADAYDEQVTLAIAWNVLGTRTKSAALQEKALQGMDALSAGTGREFLDVFATRCFADPRNNMAGINLLTRWNFVRKSPEYAIKFMQPLLKTAAGRSVWIQYDREIADPATAAKWLEEAIVPVKTSTDPLPTADSQRVQLADAFKTLSERNAIPAATKSAVLQHALELLKAVTSRGRIAQDARGILAFVYEYQANYEEAAKVYRELLKDKKDDVAYLNNLANNLAHMKHPEEKREAAAREAIGSITLAISLQKGIPGLYDTQATVYCILANDPASALRSIDQAINLERTNINWKVSRIWILAKSNQRNQAAAEYATLNKDQMARDLFPESRMKLKEAGFE